MDGKVVFVTGGAQGLALKGAEMAVEAGAHGMSLDGFLYSSNFLTRVAVYCLDCQREPSEAFRAAKDYYPKTFGGTLNYERVNVLDEKEVHGVIAHIASIHKRADGLLAGAAIQRVQPFIEYPAEEVTKVRDISCSIGEGLADLV